MRLLLLQIYPLLFFSTGIDATGIGKAWQVLPYGTDYWNHPSWPRLDSSAFEVRSVSGVGRLDSPENARTGLKSLLPADQPDDRFERITETSHDRYGTRDGTNDAESNDRIFKTGLMMTLLRTADDTGEIIDNTGEGVSRVRRDADNETKMEQITSTKNVREVRLSSPETWSSQPLSVEFPHRSGVDQMIQQTVDDEDMPNARSYHAPRADFVTSHHRRSYDQREARDMPVTRGYDEYDFPWYRNALREREYDPPSYRRGYSYYYPDRYRMERDYYMRLPQDYSYYYDRYRDEDLDLYGRSRPTPKPKRIIYYATLPEIVRKPVDLRNYPRGFDTTRTPVSRDGTYKRIPGNVDPSRYRYRHLYDGYDSYSKRSSFDRPYTYPDEEGRRKVTLESIRNNEPFDQNNDRKLASQVSIRNEGKLPWPVQIGTEVSVKDDDRIPGRKIFGDGNGYERFQSAQLQKAPDATGSSELQSDN
ncbi:PREDICTED: uncharacterized protein LOC107193810 [Dufourea novaeangliae]|uniref:Uncharacterized protein n=1 Tax=Dufourea novaeangliae TaxID=178035 RepID=A0A154NXN1_DUFNO|nr:PREDICTED: uncharacterized protein LOC107193810 [Dufourea novaeangliae]KZC03854.1 hypothetical protein WN55_00032 [Dufourea novaeangliae]